MPCRKVPLKWSLCMTKSQHTMRGAASQAVTLDDVMPAYHAGSCLSGGHLVEHLGAPQSAPERPRILQSVPKRPERPPQSAPEHPRTRQRTQSAPERPTAPQSAPQRSKTPQDAPERPRRPRSAPDRTRAPARPTAPRAPQTAPKRPSSWPHHGEQLDPLAAKGLRNAPCPLISSCLSANAIVAFIRYLA